MRDVLERVVCTCGNLKMDGWRSLQWHGPIQRVRFFSTTMRYINRHYLSYLIYLSISLQATDNWDNYFYLIYFEKKLSGQQISPFVQCGQTVPIAEIQIIKAAKISLKASFWIAFCFSAEDFPRFSFTLSKSLFKSFSSRSMLIPDIWGSRFVSSMKGFISRLSQYL